jgi:heme-degrading monooxygenase HmoA
VISASATATRELTWSPHIRQNGFSAVNIGTYSHTVIVEHAALQIRPGKTDKFLLAFSEAKQIIERKSGLQSLTLSRCIERTEVFLLPAAWDRIEDHTVGFRGSPAYQRRRQLPHQFYEPFPLVEHFEVIDSISKITETLPTP